MDPITHAVIGLSIAALSGEPLAVANPVVLGSIAGSVIPDGDIIMQLKGDHVYLKNHRGLSHSVFAMPFYALAIAGALSLLFTNMIFSKVFIYTLLGCISHISVDIMNSYGAQILWPIIKKRITFDLLLIYDPAPIILSLLIILPKTRSFMPPVFVFCVFMLYLIIRHGMKKKAITEIFSNIGDTADIIYIRVLPSLLGFIKWHFVIIKRNEKIIGEVNIYPKIYKVIRVMKNIDKSLYDMVIKTPIAEFFKEFTPIFHIDCEKKDGHYIFKFIDLRYYMSKDFLHHATAVVNHNLELVASVFHPYSKNRNVEVWWN